MRPLLVLVAVGLWAMLAVPPAMAAELPRTVPDQAEWFGELYATCLVESCGDGIPGQIVAGAREELVKGLKKVLAEPLTVEQFFDVQESVYTRGRGYLPPILPPLELQLRRDVRHLLYGVKQYLGRPPLQPAEFHRINLQVEELLYLLHGQLVDEFASKVADPQRLGLAVAGAIQTGARQRIYSQMHRQVLPNFKRPFSPAEMDHLRARAAEIPRELGPSWESEVRDLAEAGNWQRRPIVADLENVVLPGVQLYLRDLMMVYIAEVPEVLSPTEQQALDEAMEISLKKRAADWREVGEEPLP